MSKYGVPFVKGPETRLDPHPQACDIEDLQAYLSTVSGPLAIDLFCGAGGLSYGLHLAGFNIVLAAEIEHEAAQTHRAHFPGATICADLSEQSVIDSICEALSGVEIDLIAGGPPCQPYSQAAFSKVRHLEAFHGRMADPRRDLWSSYVQIVARTKPKAVLVENVPDMAFGRDGIVMRKLVDDLEGLEYDVHTRVLASDAFGVPQHRQRLFVVAFREPRLYHWPSQADFVQRVLKDAIGDLPAVEAGDKQQVRPYTGKPTALQEYYRNTSTGENAAIVYDHYSRAVRPDDLEAFKLMTPKTRYCDLPDHLKRYRDDIFIDKYKRLDMDKVSRTITAHLSRDGYWYIHPIQHRTISVREAARIQTFPDSFRFCGFPRHAFHQIGEAVPPLLGKAVGGSILQALNSGPVDRKQLSTRDSVDITSQWFQTQGASEMVLPWLDDTTDWGKVLGFMLFQRGGRQKLQEYYCITIERWPSPRRLLEDSGANAYASDKFKPDAYESLKKVAESMSQGSVLSGEMLESCGVSASLRLRILAATGMGSRRPLNASLRRLVRRFTGVTECPEFGRGTFEMLLGRIVGIDERGNVYCAMSEIAARYCSQLAPACEECPLQSGCEYSKCRSDVTEETELKLLAVAGGGEVK